MLASAAPSIGRSKKEQIIAGGVCIRRSSRFALQLIFSVVSLISSAPSHAETPWTLVWSDEFNYTGRPDPQKWGYQIGGDGWGNFEFEYYTDRLENSRVENGNLVIDVRKENFFDNHYTSARLFSVGDGWQYGRIEVRAKLPKGLGTWPAIWMLPADFGNEQPWPACGEIDIMEHAGRDPNLILGSFYSKNFNWELNTGKSQSISRPGVEDDFHVYTLEWSRDAASLGVDGVIYNVFENPHTNSDDWPFDKKFRLLLNVALGGWGGDVDDSIFPQQMLIDYVRVYQNPDDLRFADLSKD